MSKPKGTKSNFMCPKVEALRDHENYNIKCGEQFDVVRASGKAFVIIKDNVELPVRRGGFKKIF